MAELTNATVYFEVFDMVASLGFYRDLLGFAVTFASPEVETTEGRFSHFVQLRRGGVALMLNTAYDSNMRPPARTESRWAGCRYVHLYVDCDDVSSLYSELAARGRHVEAPSRTGYGYLAFSVDDPDGYRIVFHEPAQDEDLD
jgi:glyoxylase I family protein